MTPLETSRPITRTKPRRNAAGTKTVTSGSVTAASPQSVRNKPVRKLEGKRADAWDRGPGSEGQEAVAQIRGVRGSPAPEAPISKRDRILALLSRREGATLAELTAATGWQPHSVRGFLAGTVKKKLGLPLVSSKAEGQLRRYRIEAKRGR